MSRRIVWLILLLAGGTVPTDALEPPTGPVDSTTACGRRVLRVQYGNREGIRWIASRTEPWEVDRLRREAVVEADPTLEADLRAAGFPSRVDAELTAELCAMRTPLKGQTTGIPGFPCYRTLEETFATLERLVTEHPDLAELVDIGNTWEKERGLGGHDLVVLRLTNRSRGGTGTAADPSRKPAMFVMASVHAREYTPAETLTRFAETMLEGYGRDPDATWILDEHELHLLLLANPDGRVRAENGILWRKNADNDHCPDSNSRGVDLNRNFEHLWGCCGGSSGSPCSDIFRGPSAASEPETRAIQDYVRRLFPAQWSPEPPDDATGVFLDLHSYGQLVLWPWGALEDVAPNGAALETLGRRMAFLNGATPQQAIDFYPTDGSTDDFAYGEIGVAALTVETGFRFFEPCSVFETWLVDDMLALLGWTAKVARSPFLLPSGPEVVDIMVDPPSVGAGGVVAISATADDGRLGGSGEAVGGRIDRAEAWVGLPPWAEGGVAIPLTPRETDVPTRAELSGVIDTSELDEGRHLLFLRAQDSSGSWGPVSAVFLEVETYPTGPRRGARRVGY